MAQQEARRSFIGLRRSEQAPREQNPLFVGLPTLWKAMIITSFLINIVLILAVLLLGMFVLRWRSEIGLTAINAQTFARDNIMELRDVVNDLQGATIKTTIPLDQQLPLKDQGVIVPVDQETEVVLTEPVPLSLQGADIDFGGVGRLHANNIRLQLPAGTPLKIALKMNIPLDDVTIPIKLNVPVNIPLKDTELGPQFKRLGAIVERLVLPAAPLLGIEPPPIPPDPKPQTRPAQP